MTAQFIDHYEILQLSPNASSETVERVYRLLAKRYHPDNQDTGDAQKFSEVHTAYELLSNPERRAAYDTTYDAYQGETWRIFNQDAATDDRERDRRVFHGILSLLYVARRRDPQQGGLGAVTLERTLGCPREHLAFPLWYLKAHGWIETLDNGQIAITVDGIDKLTGDDYEVPDDRLLAESSYASEQAGSKARGRKRLLQSA